MSEEAHQSALDLLSRREHSRRELARKLRRKGYGRDDIEGALERLEGAGLLSDARYARLFVTDRLAVNPQGTWRLVRGLRDKGVRADLAVQAVEEIYAERGLTDREVAESLARKRLPLLEALDPATTQRRLAGYLARRGFKGSVVGDVVADVMRARLGP